MRMTEKDWRNWKVGRPTIYEYHDFDGDGMFRGVITAVYKDHAIMETRGEKLWVDDDTLYLFH